MDPLKETPDCELDRDNRINKLTDLRMVAVPRNLYYHEVAYVRRLEGLAKAIVECDPGDMAADGVTCLDVWRKEATELLKD